MAVLSLSDRAQVYSRLSQSLSQTREPCALSKLDLQAAVGAIDAWIDANAAAFNAAIPQPARGVLTSTQKARLLAAIILKRWEIS